MVDRRTSLVVKVDVSKFEKILGDMREAEILSE